MLGSCPHDVCIRDVAMGTVGVLCILSFSEVSNPPTLPASLPFLFLAPLLSPSQKLVDAYPRAGVRGGSQCPVVSP